MLFLDGKSIAQATSHTLSVTTDVEEISSKDYGDYSAKTPQKISWSLTTDNLFTHEGYKQLMTAQRAMEPVTAYFGMASDYASTGLDDDATYYNGPDTAYEYTYGDVLITNLQVTAQSGANSTFTVTLDGQGPLQFVVPA